MKKNNQNINQFQRAFIERGKRDRSGTEIPNAIDATATIPVDFRGHDNSLTNYNECW